MEEDAFIVLEALGRGSRADAPGDRRWIEAFKTIRWAVEGDSGPILTPEGRRARDQMALERRGARTPDHQQTATPRRAAVG